MPEEEFETGELKEAIDQRLEEHEEHEHGHGEHAAGPAKHVHHAHAGHAHKPAGQPGWLRLLSLSTAMIAVIAAVASLESGSKSNEAILEKSNAMLNQSLASDQWSYFQAKGIKATLSEGEAAMVADSKPDVATKLTSEAKRYRGETAEIQKKAQELEDQVKENNHRSSELMEQHHHFAIAVTLLQIAIALSAIAALTRRKQLWYVSMATSLGGLGLFIVGML
jgi:hypothetical protein